MGLDPCFSHTARGCYSPQTNDGAVSLTSNLTVSWGQFTARRFIVYISTGIAEMVGTNYLAEICPARTRGLVAESMIDDWCRSAHRSS